MDDVDDQDDGDQPLTCTSGERQPVRVAQDQAPSPQPLGRPGFWPVVQPSSCRRPFDVSPVSSP